MIHFYGLCHRSCALKCITGVLELRKLDFRGLKGQLDVKKAKIGELISKIGYLRPVLTSRIHLRPILMNFAIGVVLLRYVEGILKIRKSDFRGLKGQFDEKRLIFEDL